MARDSVLSLNCGVHEFLRSLLELFLGGLGIRVSGSSSLILYLYVDWLAIGTCSLSLLLGLGGLVATVHGVVHHSSSIEWIVILGLVFCT